MTLSGCATKAAEIPLKSASLNEAVVSDAPKSTRRFKVTVTLSEPQDLKVREGDVIQAGQLLSDRVNERARLDGQKKQIDFQLQRLAQPIIEPLPPRKVPSIPELPNPSYLEEEANVDRQSVEAEISEKERENQQRLIDALKTLDPESIPPSTLEHEAVKFAQKDRDFQKQIADKALAKGKLDKSKEKFGYEQYRHGLEISKRDIEADRHRLEYQRQLQEYQKQKGDRAFQVSEATAKLQVIESQLAGLSVVRSPYAGTIKKIKWVGQNDRNLSVELVLITDQSSGTPNPQATITSPGQTTTTTKLGPKSQGGSTGGGGRSTRRSGDEPTPNKSSQSPE